MCRAKKINFNTRDLKKKKTKQLLENYFPIRSRAVTRVLFVPFLFNAVLHLRTV